MTKIILTTLLIIFTSGASYANDFELDRGIGFDKGRDIEDWVDTKESRKYSAGFDPYSKLGANGTNFPINASSIGNIISITTEPGSHVVVNAQQINNGNQITEVNLKGVKEYQNVE